MEIKTVYGKIVVVGDEECGKTCLLEVFRRDKFIEKYIPTIVDNFYKTIFVDGKEINLELWDTAGDEDFDSIRPLSYKDTSLIILCYSIEDKERIVNIKKKWIYEIKKFCPTVPFFLVALKKDIRDMSNSLINKNKLITTLEGGKLANEIGAKRFFECSAQKGVNINEIFNDAARVIINPDVDESNIPNICNYCCLF